ncbi:hypothetical protein H1C71_008984, partial [Ictidomys tridecemlineatus]
MVQGDRDEWVGRPRPEPSFDLETLVPKETIRGDHKGIGCRMLTTIGKETLEATYVSSDRGLLDAPPWACLVLEHRTTVKKWHYRKGDCGMGGRSQVQVKNKVS